jgi:hypothetical protein
LRPSSREGANGGCPNDLNDATHATRRRKIVENVRKSSRNGIAGRSPNRQRHQVGDVRRRIAAKRWRTRSPQRSLHHGAKSVASSGRTGRYGSLGVMPTEFLKLNARPIGRSPGPKIDLIANPKTALDSAWASFDSHNDKVVEREAVRSVGFSTTGNGPSRDSAHTFVSVKGLLHQPDTQSSWSLRCWPASWQRTEPLRGRAERGKRRADFGGRWGRGTSCGSGAAADFSFEALQMAFPAKGPVSMKRFSRVVAASWQFRLRVPRCRL